MPNDLAPLPIVDVNLENEPFKFAKQSLSDSYALSLVKQTFNDYESFRAQNHDGRWNIADSLYVGYLPQKTWESTTIPRSSLPVPIIFDQVEAAIPAISQEIFAPGDDWFQVETEPGSDIKEAREVQEHLSYVLEHSKNDYGLSARNEVELAIKSILLYGNGGISVEWDSLLNRPVIQWVDIRDFYIDPGCPVPSVDESRSIIRRKFFTVEELTRLRQDPRMSIPEDSVLYHMSKLPQFAVGDQTKRNAEAFRGVNFVPESSDYSALPSERKIEVLIYYSKSKIIWVLNREWVAYNEDNPYEFIPFCFAPCYTVPGRFYAQSIADVQESNQRYIEALLNGRLDAVTMSLMPPRIYKQGQLMTPSQLRWYPGATYKSDDVKNMALLQPQTETANVYTEIQFLIDASEKRTGVNSMNSGIPRPSNTNRTATGVQAVSSGSMSRLRAIVSNVENYLIVPMLYKLYTLVQKHNLPDSQLNGISSKGGLTKVNSSSFTQQMRFRMLASSRMMTRDKLASTFPFLVQYMLNGTFMGGIQKTGQTVDFGEVFQMLRDATGTGRLYNFIRPMNQQEQQAASQPPPELQAQMQSKQQDLQSRQQLGQLKSQTDIQVAKIAHTPDPNQQAMDSQQFQQEAQANLQQMQMETAQKQQEMQMDKERDAARLHSEQVMAQIKAEAAQKKSQTDMAAQIMGLHSQQQQQQMDLQGQQQEHALSMQQIMQQNQISQQQSEDQRVNAQEDHKQNLTQQQETHQAKLQAAKDVQNMRPSRGKRAERSPKAKPPSA